MRKFFISLIFIVSLTITGFSQKPKDGTYTYDLAFAEWGGKTNGTTVLVKIKGDSIYVILKGGNLSGVQKGDIIEKGILMKHKPTGKWIIGHSAEDMNAKEIGGCSEGPTEIDFKRKRVWTC